METKMKYPSTIFALAVFSGLICTPTLAQENNCPTNYIEGGTTPESKSIETFFSYVTKRGNETPMVFDWMLGGFDASNMQGKHWSQWSKNNWQTLISALNDVPNKDYWKYFLSNNPSERQLFHAQLREKIAIVQCYADSAEKNRTRTGSQTPSTTTTPRVVPSVTTSPEERLQHCQNEAYVQGVNGDQRKAFMTACIKNAAANTRKDNSSKQIAKNEPSEPNASVQDWPTNQPNTAPFINPKCVDFKQTGKGISDMFKTVYNHCTAPVQVLFCFEDRKNPGRDCKNSDVGWGTTSTIRPGRSTQVSAVPTSWTVHYMVCDMHNPKLLCVRPR